VQVPESQDSIAYESETDRGGCQHGETLIQDPAEVAVRVTTRATFGSMQLFVVQRILNAAAIRK
jgi:hypothetical protein